MTTLRLGGVLLASVLVLAACSSSDDDSGGDAGDVPTDGMDGDNMDGDGMDGDNMDGDGMDGAGDAASGSLLDIAGRDADSDPVVLDRMMLDTEIAELLGDGDSDGPLLLEDDDTALSALRRRRDAQGL